MIYKVYRSKVDHWLAAVLIAAPLLPVGLAVYLHQPFLLGITVFVLAIYGVAALPVSYEAGSDQLVIRCGLARTNISYSEIHSMRPTRSALSSPALSLDRIEIRYAQAGGVLISPVDRRAFLEDMRIHVPQAEITVS